MDLSNPRWHCGSFSAKGQRTGKCWTSQSMLNLRLYLPYYSRHLFCLFRTTRTLLLVLVLVLLILLIILNHHHHHHNCYFTAVRGQLLVISCKKYVRYKWSCCCCYDEKKKKHSPCPTHHLFPKTGLPRHKPLHRLSFRGDNNQEFKWSARHH